MAGCYDNPGDPGTRGAGWGAEKAAVGAERDARRAGSWAVKAPGGKGAIRRKLKLATNCGATCCYYASLKKPLLQIRCNFIRLLLDHNENKCWR